MKLFKTLEEIQAYYKVNGTQKLSSLEGFERDALEKYIRRYTGQALLDEIVEWYAAKDDENNTANEELEALLPYVQNAAIKFTYFLAAPSLDLQITEQGFVVANTGNISPASKDRVSTFRQSLESLAWDAVESLLKFLEKNKEDYDFWTESDAYTIQTGLFINTAEEFNKHVNIDDSVLKFLEMKQTIEDVEFLSVYPEISSELAEGIKEEIKSDDVSDSNKKILPYIKKAVANLTAYECGMGDRFNKTGRHYLMEAKKIIDATPSDYPLYASSATYLSQIESASATPYQRIENSEESSIFIMGG